MRAITEGEAMIPAELRCAWPELFVHFGLYSVPAEVIHGGMMTAFIDEAIREKKIVNLRPE